MQNKYMMTDALEIIEQQEKELNNIYNTVWGDYI